MRRPGTFSPPLRVRDPGMHRGTRCMPGSLTSGFLWSQWRGKHSRHSRCMRNPQFYVSGKRPMLWYHCVVFQVEREKEKLERRLKGGHTTVSDLDDSGNEDNKPPAGEESSIDKASKTCILLWDHETLHYLSSYPGYFREPHWNVMGLPEISRGTLQVWHLNGYSLWNTLNSKFRAISRCLFCHGPLNRYAKLRVVHAPGMSGTFSPPTT